MGFRIFRHSVGLVFNQFGAALRISGLLYLAIAIFHGLGLYLIGSGTSADQSPQFRWEFIFVVLPVGVLYLWIVVAWHRFVLLDETSGGPVPALLADRLFAYFGRGMQVALIFMAGGVAMAVVIAVLVYALPEDSVVVILVPLVMLAIVALIFYRLAPLLPAAAIGKPIGIRAAWAATSGAWGTILLLTLVSAIAFFIIDLPATILLRQSASVAPVALVWLSITGWVKLMVGASVLTTLYGVYVERRAIA